MQSFVAGVNRETEAIIKDYFLHGLKLQRDIRIFRNFLCSYSVLAPATSDFEKAEFISYMSKK